MKRIISFILVCLLAVNTAYAKLPTEYDEYYNDKDKGEVEKNKERFESFLSDKEANEAKKACACFNLNHDMSLVSRKYICDVEKKTQSNSFETFILNVEKRKFPLPFLKDYYVVYTYDDIWFNILEAKNIVGILNLDINQTYVCPALQGLNPSHYDTLICNTCSGEFRKILFISSKFEIFFHKGRPKQNLIIFPYGDEIKTLGD